MGQIERNADTRDAIGRAPLVTQPRVKTEASKPCGIELFAEARYAIFEPGVAHREAEITQANVEELLGR
jgi:hypothetical protein